MRCAAFAFASLLSLAGCPSEPGSEPRPSATAPSVTPTGAPIHAEVVSSTRTIDTAGASPSTTPEATDPADPSAAPAGCPAWAGAARCALDGNLYASASARGIANASLARTTAGNRARAALLGGKPGTLEGSQVVETVSCGGAVWALGRVPASGPELEGIGECAFGAPAP